ncbi:response regulator [Sulfitobacter mediterraneus]|uniref:response regulator n=1 Tax=Sulfitobacter mediterraneus TaxID=83219 RepID=UPI000EA16EC4|nr:response regulator [Sulfitobacter mediterraneus]
MSPTPHILVVDDHAEIRQSVTRYLQKNGMQATGAGNTSEMDDHLSKETIDLIVLDIMMPGEDGLAACARLRREHRMTPILMLTALGEDDDRINGLDTGADDYLAKPFNPRELLARINAILRRSSEAPSPHGGTLAGKRAKFAGITFEHDASQVTKQDGTVNTLTTAEAKLLSVLLERPRAVISRDELLELSAGRMAGPFDRTIDNQVSRLRRKIEPDVLRPRIITTVRNGGYCLNCDVDLES